MRKSVSQTADQAISLRSSYQAEPVLFHLKLTLSSGAERPSAVKAHLFPQK